MPPLISIVPSVISVVVLIITGAIGYGKLVQKIDSLSKDIDNVRRGLSTTFAKMLPSCVNITSPILKITPCNTASDASFSKASFQHVHNPNLKEKKQCPP